MNQKHDYSNNLTVKQFLDSIHRYTEWVNIKIVNDIWQEERKAPEYLSRDVFKAVDKDHYGDAEYNRLIEYYGSFHVWNVHATFEWLNNSSCFINEKGHFGTPAIEAHIHFSEIRDAWYRERADIKKAKRREYNRKRREDND